MSKNLHLQSVYLKSRQQMKKPILNLRKCELSNAAMRNHLKAYTIIPSIRQSVVSKIVTRTRRTRVLAAKTVSQLRTKRKPPQNLDPDPTQWCRQAILRVHSWQTQISPMSWVLPRTKTTTKIYGTHSLLQEVLRLSRAFCWVMLFRSNRVKPNLLRLFRM